jgi:hypothetical protein
MKMTELEIMLETISQLMCGVFASDHCNVCGCALQGDSEHALGMCTAHANEGAEL